MVCGLNIMSISDIISTLSVLILGSIAIFKVKIDNYFVKPELTSEVDLEPPCCHRTTAVSGGPSINNCFTNITFKQYYFRLRVINKGNISAKNVEVIISEIYKKTNESFEKVLTFPLSNLLWSVTRKMYIEYLSPKTYKYCNLCYTNEPEQNNKENIKLCFDIFFKSNIGYYIFQKGEYKIILLLACANSSKAVKQEYLLKFNGKWYDEESEMFKYGVNIKKIKQ
jgi:hypothetical protein